MKLLVKAVFACLMVLAFGPACRLARGSDQDAKLIVQDIQCRGNVSTSCKFIRGHLYLQVGGMLDEDEVKDAKLRLSALPNFRSVDIYLEKGSEKGRVVVVIEVAETDSFTMALVLGTSFRQNTDIQTFAARFSDHNLFGAGKILDLLVVGDAAVTRKAAREYATRLEYFDPQLFGSNRYFLATGLFYSRSAYNFPDSGALNNGSAGADASLGRRFGSFSYATVGYRSVFSGYRFFSNSSQKTQYLAFDGNLTTLTDSSKSVLLFTYGRNSEDDSSFPTRGWMFHLYDNWDPSGHGHFAGAEARATWRGGSNSFWTVQTRPFNDFRAPFDDDLGTSLTYARSIEASDYLGGIRRGRWYIGPGVTVVNHATLEVGMKAGIRLDTRHCGIVNLYVIGSRLVGTGAGY
ncbi:MAG: outer membrane protein assembly factor YaeT precursor [Gammaproteobacteria bacterium]|jgi:outer membrane protein assembly factor BamA|nr:outer membrane protein assembly factor YaeT precursor [Gammaproteobacteria bacterium]